MLPHPLTPRTNTRGPVGPSSPPQTPSTASPVDYRKAAAAGRPQGRTAAATNRQFACPTPPAPLYELGNGRHPRSNFFDPLSPRGTDSSEEEEEDEDEDDEEEEVEDEEQKDDEVRDDEDEEGDDEADGADTDSSASRSRAGSMGSTHSDVPMSPPIIIATRVVVNYDLVIVEVNDSDSDHGLPVLRPHHIEYADSDRSRSRSRRREVNMTTARMEELAVESGSETEGETNDFDQQRQRLRMEKRMRRRTMSIGKRTITESIGSESDHEDIGPLGVDDLGSSARRLRRRLGDRRSLQFTDPPPERIDECDEPPTSDDDMKIEYEEWEFLAKELPYYPYFTMEVDSP